jgi:hypothetical protein
VPADCIAVDDYNHAGFEGPTKTIDEFLEGRMVSYKGAV